MNDITDLYQDLVLDHNSKPRNFRKEGRFNRTAEGYNPLCGDRVRIDMLVEGDVIEDVSFQGNGCAISRASASMMTEAVKGKTATEAERIFDRFRRHITGEADDGGADTGEDLGDLEAFAGLKEYPSRVKCATLGWHTMKAALEGRETAVSLE